jgi:polyhydroxybutyrate depolymerase
LAYQPSPQRFQSDAQAKCCAQTHNTDLAMNLFCSLQRALAACAAAALLTLAACGGGGGSADNNPPAATAAPPTISTQPVAQTTTAPSTATFTAAATGSGTLAYQWQRNGVDIAGATASSYTTAATSESDSGALFTVKVSNAGGSVLSAAAALRINGTLVRETFTHEGLQRQVLKYTPSGLPSAAVPLVIVLHGGSEDAETTASDARPTKAWRDLADVDKFVVLYPDAIGKRWNDCRSDSTSNSTANDVGFVSALIDRASTQRAIDTDRVYATGPSNGGMMSLRLGLELSNRLAGIAPQIANNPVDPLRACRAAPGRALSVVLMPGTEDPLMPFAGGAVSGTASSGFVLSANATRDFWVSANGCASTPTTTALPNLDTTDGSTVVQEAFSGCANQHRVVVLRVEGGGHLSPSKRYLIAGRQNRDIESADEVWRHLKDARRSP